MPLHTKASDWTRHLVPTDEGYYRLETPDTAGVPVRLFLTPRLIEELEPALYPQIVNATRFPGVRLVVLTPDVHLGYGVPVGSVILTDRASGAVALDPGAAAARARESVAAQDDRAGLRTVTVDADPARVTVTVTGTVDLTLLRLVRGGRPFVVRVEATARPHLLPCCPDRP